MNPNQPELISRLVGNLTRCSTREMNALHGWRPGKPAPPAVAKLIQATLNTPAGRNVDPTLLPKWALICNGLAVMSFRGFERAHNPKIPLGRALHNGTPSQTTPRHGPAYSEPQFALLMTSSDQTLTRHLHRMFHWLAARRLQIDWGEVAHLILAPNRTEQETIKANIALDYYRANSTNRTASPGAN